jgi:hypothetical protein
MAKCIDSRYTRQRTDKLTAYKRDILDKSKRLIIVRGFPSTGKTKTAI